MGSELNALFMAAAGIGFVHTLIGPDHYLPFLALAQARRWTFRRTLMVTFLCGLGHVASSIALGALGLSLGWTLGRLEGIEGQRGDAAGWLLLALGVAYCSWGIRRAVRNRPHSHFHSHADGTVHEHQHQHLEEHAHLHEAPSTASRSRKLTVWSLFLIFVLGPCEPLVPLLMYPAAAAGLKECMLVVAVFALTTLATMTGIVAIGLRGVRALPTGPVQRWSHAFAGGIITACAVAILLGL